MNAAARLVHQGVLARHVVLVHLLTRKQCFVMLLALAVLLSALSIIYVTHTTRVLHAVSQRHLLEQDRLHVQNSQLLLERSTWMRQSRIQQAAENELNMVFPDKTSLVMTQE